MKRVILAMFICVGVVGAQQSGVLNWNPNGSVVSINAPTTSGTAFNYALPTKSGTLALTTDIPPPVSAPAPSVINGTITLAGGTGTAIIPSTTSRCVVSDPSGNSVRYMRGATVLTVFGAGQSVDFICV